MRIAVLCNDRLGLPALQQMAQGRMIIAAATSDRTPEMQVIMQQLSAQAGVPVTIFSRKNFEADLLLWLDQHKPDVVLVKTFPYRIPAAALNIPKHGFINFHYAPLPAFRGSNPLFWMIKESVTMGGISVHRMDENFDTGPVLLHLDVPIRPGDTFGICSTQLAYAGVDATNRLLQGLINGQLKSAPQNTAATRWYGRPKAADLEISWKNMDAKNVRALVNACNPWQKGAVARWRGWPFGITDAIIPDGEAPENSSPGTLLHLSPEKGCVIVCKDQTLIRAEVIYSEEGFFPGYGLLRFGLEEGHQLDM